MKPIFPLPGATASIGTISPWIRLASSAEISMVGVPKRAASVFSGVTKGLASLHGHDGEVVYIFCAIV